MNEGQVVRMLLKSMIVLGLYATFSLGQENPNSHGQVYRVGVEGGVDAITYPYGSAPTKIDFRGTVLLPEAKGVAFVQSRSGRTEIDAKFDKLPLPTRFGWQYPTYVLWAISPEGASHNLGELILQESNRARLQATSDLQTFALIVTAEPYSAVRQPSGMVMLQNHVRPGTVGTVVPVRPNPGLTPMSEYSWQAAQPSQTAAEAAKASMNLDDTLRQLYQAENAVTIARLASAERYAPESFAAAQHALSAAQRLYTSKGDSKFVIQNAREATQRADDARTIAERRRQEGGADGGRELVLAKPAPVPHYEANREALEPALRARLHEKVDGTLLAQDTQRGLVLTLPDAAFDGVTLLGSIAQKLGPVASALISQPSAHVEIEGHMDSAELASWERAQAVGSALAASGLPANQISMRGGVTTPARPGQDRRVQIVISGEIPGAQITPSSIPAAVASPVTQTIPEGPIDPDFLAGSAADPDPASSADPPIVNAVSSPLALPQRLPMFPDPPAAFSQGPPSVDAIRAALPKVAFPIHAAQLPRPRQPPTAPVLSPAKEAVSHHARGRMLLQEERYQEAIQELTEAVTLSPSLALAYNARGYAYLRLRQYQAAIDDFDTALRLNPAYANAYVNRSSCRRALGDKAGALADQATADQLEAMVVHDQQARKGQ